MKLRILLLLIFFWICQVPLAWADYIQGHVMRVDQQQGEVVIILCDVCTGENHCKNGDNHDPEHGADGVMVTVVAAWLPRCLSEGMMIFARGIYSPDDQTRFLADEVFPKMKRGGKDKTGVRSRFRHHGWRWQHE